MKKQFAVMTGVLMLSLSVSLAGCGKKDTTDATEPAPVAQESKAETQETLSEVLVGDNNTKPVDESTEKPTYIGSETDADGELVTEAYETTEAPLPSDVQAENEAYEAGEVLAAEGENGEPAEKQEVTINGKLDSLTATEAKLIAEDGTEMILTISADTKVGEGVEAGVEVEMSCNGVMTRSLPAQVPVVYSLKTKEQADKDYQAELESINAGIEDDEDEAQDTNEAQAQ